MSRTLTQATRQAVFASQTGEAFLCLVTIDHPELAQPVRVSSDAVDTASRGDTFTAMPFQIALPEDSDARPPRAKLKIDNVSRKIVETLRSISSAPTVLIELVRGADPDTVEASFPDFKLREGRYDVLTVEGDLDLEDYLTEPYPAGVFSPAHFRGLF